MRSWKCWLSAAAVLVLAAGVVMALRSGAERVETAAVIRGSVVDAVYATGEVRAIRRAEVSAEVSGRVVSVEVEAGDTVEADMVLARIETTSLEHSRSMAEQSLAAAQSRWEEAQRDLKRRQALLGEGAVSKAEYDAAKSSE